MFFRGIKDGKRRLIIFSQRTMPLNQILNFWKLPKLGRKENWKKIAKKVND